jgi:hypothetical protein
MPALPISKYRAHGGWKEEPSVVFEGDVRGGPEGSDWRRGTAEGL